jgi:hypothetical protein
MALKLLPWAATNTVLPDLSDGAMSLSQNGKTLSKVIYKRATKI